MRKEKHPTEAIMAAVRTADTLLPTGKDRHPFDWPVAACVELLARHIPRLRTPAARKQLTREITAQMIRMELEESLRKYSDESRGSAGQTDLLSKSPQP